METEMKWEPEVGEDDHDINNEGESLMLISDLRAMKQIKWEELSDVGHSSKKEAPTSNALQATSMTPPVKLRNCSNVMIMEPASSSAMQWKQEVGDDDENNNNIEDEAHQVEMEEALMPVSDLFGPIFSSTVDSDETEDFEESDPLGDNQSSPCFMSPSPKRQKLSTDTNPQLAEERVKSVIPMYCTFGCKVKFDSQEVLNLHLEYVHGNRQFPCPCGRVFCSELRRRKHQMNCRKLTRSIPKQRKDLKAYISLRCNLCSGVAEFNSQECLLAHKIRDHGETPFTCYICRATFVWKEYLDKHFESVH